jgi:hypothetical protein
VPIMQMNTATAICGTEYRTESLLEFEAVAARSCPHLNVQSSP